MLKTIKIPRSTYYYLKSKIGKPDKHSKITKVIGDIKRANKSYGYRRVCLELANHGYQVNHKLVLKIMKSNHWLSTAYSRKLRKYNSYKGQVGKISKNLINRKFKTDRPYQKLTTDISEFRYGSLDTDHRIYLSPIMDLYSGEIISFNISDHPTVECVMKPLEDVIERIKGLKYRTTIHSDQGIQYQSHVWQHTLTTNNIFQSMSRKGNCLDNSPMESFFHIMKAEAIETAYDSKENLVSAMKLWIDYYNNHQIKIKLGGKSPIQYRELSA
ncbi:IS3 family transposase (plasmid) [Nicoliella spurrieriana]|uniref:IS3 family transposase n=1 Tax=Nicoliella spurrieriana TaxID=2925830 RepID=A0A976RQX4_9LACO|nr:IS3 family transposase [Nicoliella spurrieriana]UQS86167.1 IS3 family transposase [Nicoliella spurrieriana]